MDDLEPKLSLKETLDLIKPFNGSQENMFKFVNTCDFRRRFLHKIHKDDFYRRILSEKLTNEAKMVLKRANTSSWKHFKRSIFRLISEKKPSDYWLTLISRTKQGSSEDVVSFANKLEYYYVNMVDSACFEEGEPSIGFVLTYENLTLHTFTDGLQKEAVKTILRDLAPKDLEQAVDFALLAERTCESEKKNAVKNKFNIYQREISLSSIAEEEEDEDEIDL